FETQITPLFDKLCTDSEEGRNQNIIGDITWRLFSAGVQSANSVFLRCLHRIPNSKQQFCDNLRFISKDRRSTWNGYSELLEACDRQ
ncbi:MAG: hypothetical protein KDD62_14390, partial [Bdellovibrionales bacterium]|nr:hypothetical protein [Bdellovibrionales bacterium]